MVAWLYLIGKAAGELVMMTEDGKPLNANNAIGQGWKRLVERAKVRPLTFKFLRKTACAPDPQ